MVAIFLLLTCVLVVAHLLPLVNDQHWIFRIGDFGRIQIFVLQLLVIVLGFIFIDEKEIGFWLSEGILMALAIHNVWILYPYTSFYRLEKVEIVDQHSSYITVLSANVYQFNKEYDRMITLVKEIDPDIVLTMESNLNWEDALAVLDSDYPHRKKVPLDNCYGMHFYSKLQVEDIKVHFFVADDLPSIEASLLTGDGFRFTFFGVHPPPPSPTEENTSKERDGDLMAIARRISEINQPVIAVGDFNIVAWSRVTKLFRKAARLTDSRKGRGFVPTFHVNYPLFRFPIDLLFHSREIIIENLEAQKDIGSDHFPLFCKFFINLQSKKPDREVDELDHAEKQEIEEIIDAGKKAEGNRGK